MMSSVTVGRSVSSCARAASAEEAAFRIDYPLAPARGTRVVGMDPEALETVREAAALDWAQARFYGISDPGHDLLALDGTSRALAEELEGVDSLLMVAASGENAEAAATVGAACKVRGIMTAGLVLTPGRITSDALIALRPYARILLVPAEPDDLVELLKAIRA
jgi:hypothetical protein